MKIVKKLTVRFWVSLALVGLMGQFAWTLENMYLNLYLYNTISTDPGYIAAMVAASAVTATLTTLLMGALSDRLGRRKVFIGVGYILWGIATAGFGLATVENAARLFPAASAIHMAAVLVIALDCVMTFFGSTANDAAFNAYVTESVEQSERGRVESVLSILPLLSMLIVFGGFDSLTQQGQWKLFFGIFGAGVFLVGVLSLFLLKDTAVAPGKESFFFRLIYGFRPSVIKTHAGLYLSLVALCIFSIAVQIYFPYLIIYMQHYLRLESYALVLGIVLIFASGVSVATGRLIDRAGRLRLIYPAIFILLAGLLGMYFARGMVWVILMGAVMMSGFMLVTTMLTAEMRDLTPVQQAGHFQGIRMIFVVMLPMIIGPFIGAAVIRGYPETYVDLGVSRTVPTPAIFLAAAITLCFLFVPVVLLKRKPKKQAGEEGLS